MAFSDLCTRTPIVTDSSSLFPDFLKDDRGLQRRFLGILVLYGFHGIPQSAGMQGRSNAVTTFATDCYGFHGTPEPSWRVTSRSASTPSQISLLPLGQWTMTALTSWSRPKPKCTRWSLAFK